MNCSRRWQGYGSTDDDDCSYTDACADLTAGPNADYGCRVAVQYLSRRVIFQYAPAQKGIDGQYSGKQGQVLVVKVKGEEQATEVKGTFLKRTIPFFREFRPAEPAGYIGLLGIDMQDEPGTYELAVEVRQGEQAKQLSFNILVAKRSLPSNI
jgi:hypothetical protein